MLHCGNQCLQLLRLGADALGAQIRMTGNGTIQQRLLLTVSRIGNRQTFVAAWCLSCRHIEDKVSVLDPLTRLGAVVVSAILTRAITYATDLAAGKKNQL